jgi:hypothetical protein
MALIGKMCRVRSTKKAKEDATFCLIKDVTFFTPFLSDEPTAMEAVQSCILYETSC